MNSAERHERRYQKRKAKRELKRKEYIKQYGNIENVYDFANLYVASRLCQRGVNWKNSTQRYCAHRIYNIMDTIYKIKNNKEFKKGLKHFTIYERGKKRDISSVHISERVIQKSIMLNVLLPVLSKSLIHDNGASLKNKGISFAQKRIEYQLHKYYRKHGNRGYVLMIDFSSYFANIRHDKVREMLLKYFSIDVVNFIMQFISYERNIGIGLGSEISQIIAIYYANSIDHYIKEKLCIKGYGRYMDDSYLIHHNKEYLKECLRLILPLYQELGIVINKNKTQISRIDKGFLFLKTNYILTKSGEIVRKPFKKFVGMQRRKLKKLSKIYYKGEISLADIYASYQAWRAHMMTKNSFHILRNMDKLYINLFNKNYRECVNNYG